MNRSNLEKNLDDSDETLEEIKITYSSEEKLDLLYTETIIKKAGEIINIVWTYSGKTVYATYVSEKVARKLEKYWKEAKKMPEAKKENFIRMINGSPKHEGFNGRVFGFYFSGKSVRRFYSAPITKIEPSFED